MFRLIKKHGYGFFMKMTKDRVDASSAQVAFFIVISFLPLLMFIISILQMVDVSGVSLLNSIISLLPDTAESFVTSLFNRTNNTHFTIMSVSAVTMLWTASTAIFAMLKALNQIFRVDQTASFFRVRGLSIIYTVIFIVMLVVTVVLFVFADPLYSLLTEHVNENLAKFLLWIRDYFGFWLLFIFFLLSFKVVPRKAKIKLRYSAIGAFISSAGWMIFSYIFSLYVDNLANYSSIYGSLATIVILMLWLYFLMTIMFISAEVVAWVQMSSFRHDFGEFLGAKRKLRKEKKKLNRLEKRYLKGKELSDEDNARLLELREKITGDSLPPEGAQGEIFPGQAAPDMEKIETEHKDAKQRKKERKLRRQEERIRRAARPFDEAPESYLGRPGAEFGIKRDKGKENRD